MAGGRDRGISPGLAGKITSLEVELEEYFFELFSERHRLLADSCPGEEKCATKGRIFERRQYEGPELPVLRVCHGSEELGERPCDALATKPGNHPPHLMQGVASAFELTELKRATYIWPDSLAPAQWTSLRAFERAEANVKRQLDDEQEEKRRYDQIMADLDRQRR